MFEDQTRYLDITNASGLACQTILLHIDKLLSVALKHYCPDVWQFVVQMFGNLFVEVKEDSKRGLPGKNPVSDPTMCQLTVIHRRTQ